jgi:two-component system NtrC family sensor kinase
VKYGILILFFLSLLDDISAQRQTDEDSLKEIINRHKDDTAQVNSLSYLASLQVNSDTAILYAKEGLALAQKLHYKKGQSDCFFIIAWNKTDFAESIQNALNALKIYEGLHDNTGIASSHLALQGTYWTAGDYKNALTHAFAGKKVAEINDLRGLFAFSGHRLTPLFSAEIGQIYLLKNQLDSALIYARQAIEINELFNGATWNFPVCLLGAIYNKKGNYELALVNYRSAFHLAKQNEIFRDTLQVYSGMSDVFRNTAQVDSSIYYAQIVERSTNPEKEIGYLLSAIENLAHGYKIKGNKDSVIKYIELGQTLKDSVFNNDKNQQVQAVTFNENLKQQQLVEAQLRYKNRVQLYVFAGGIFILVLIAIILWRNNRQKQKAKEKIEKAYGELKTAQAQLIQSEKMASLGELTAGIAHEIQNPLNFVNNFSDVNAELIDEAGQEMDKGNVSETKKILNDIKENEQKINHHGKRADAIVKGMLQHSRNSSGVKEPTDINALADEYLRLAYHGLRAKNNSFNAITKTDYDNSISKINIIPQDIGRVVLNLINNAFYAVDEKKKQNQNGYEPTVSVSTKKTNGKVEISIKDNGNGIPQKVLDKIFQPFFTTKPTGQGTGLGLSLSYDIVKAHGGELKVETKEGEGSEFIIYLPA